MIPYQQLQQILSPKLTQEELHALPKSYDIIGDILVTTLPEQLLPHQAEIGTAYLIIHPNIKVVAIRVGHCVGEYRTRQLLVIAGENRLDTIHKENGILLEVNPSTVYFSTRMAGERQRLSSTVVPGEHICVLCSGIAPLPLILSRLTKAKKIVGIEKNPLAFALAERNVHRNNACDTVDLYHGDAMLPLPLAQGSFDRVITMLPTEHEKLLKPALTLLRPGGILNHYAMVQTGQQEKEAQILAPACIQANRQLASLTWLPCGHCSPTTYRYCFTATID